MESKESARKKIFQVLLKSGKKLKLLGHDLSCLEFFGKSFREADLRKVDLRRSNFSVEDFQNTNLKGAFLNAQFLKTSG
jgi:uncharacterized protein YjbI with pentapeptide repeats